MTLLLVAACNPANAEVTSFEECVAAGNPVMESYPRQCRADGVLFVEQIEQDANVRVDMLQAGDLVESPLTITGEARLWYFEASFPVRLLDGNGREIAVAPAQAQDDWMTEDFVPFSVTLTFDALETDEGTLILEKDNPSGLPENAAYISIPVRFR